MIFDKLGEVLNQLEKIRFCPSQPIKKQFARTSPKKRPKFKNFVNISSSEISTSSRKVIKPIQLNLDMSEIKSKQTVTDRSSVLCKNPKLMKLSTLNTRNFSVSTASARKLRLLSNYE